jgi:ferredoxin
VSIDVNNQKFEVKKGEILFDALDNLGEQLAHGCLAGSCGVCKIEVLENPENLQEASAVEKDTISAIKTNYERIHGAGSAENKVIRLSCRAKVIGDVKIAPL